jgi:putative proteasome-type protease
MSGSVTSFEQAIKLLLVSFDSTIKSNLSVGLPLDYAIYRAGALDIGPQGQISGDDPYYRAVSDGWGAALQYALRQLPEFRFDLQAGESAP